MGFIFNRTPKDEPECLAVQVIDGAITKCCDASRRKGPLPELVADASADKIKRVVTLVHGTFARHAPWMQDTPKKVEEGALCSALRGIEGTAIRRFCWSGGNSHSARLQAGDDLALYLSQLRMEFPDAQHFVIAHSHGGNVAMYAMEAKLSDGEKHGDGIAGVITLATPFITLRKRQLPKFVIPSALIALAFIVVVFLVSVMMPPEVSQSSESKTADAKTADLTIEVAATFDSKTAETNAAGIKAEEIKSEETEKDRKWKRWALISSLATLFAVWVTGTIFSAWMYGRRNFNIGILWKLFRERNKPEQPLLDDQLRALQPHSLEANKLLVMRPLGDEANMSLVVSQSLSYAQNKLLSFLQGFQDGFLGRSSNSGVSAKNSEETKPKRGSGCFMSLLKLFVLLVLVIYASMQTHPDSAEKEAVFAVAMGVMAISGNGLVQLLLFLVTLLFAGLLAFFVVYGFMSLYALIGLLLSAAPFGWDAMFWNHFTSTTAEPAPVGSSPAHIFHAAPKDGSVDPHLAHSGIYTNPVAIEQIVDWIRRR